MQTTYNSNAISPPLRQAGPTPPYVGIMIRLFRPYPYQLSSLQLTGQRFLMAVRAPEEKIDTRVSEPNNQRSKGTVRSKIDASQRSTH